MQTGIDPRLYSGEELDSEFKTEFERPNPSEKIQQFEEPRGTVPVADLTAGVVTDRQGELIREEAQRDKHTVAESIGAGMTMSDTSNFLEWWSSPGFTPDSEYTPRHDMEALEFAPTRRQFEYLMKAESHDEFEWRRGRVQVENEAQEIARDNPVASMIPMFLDPAYLGVDMLTLGAGRALRVGRAVAGVTAGIGAGGIALGAGQARPQDMHEVAFASLLNAAATSLVYRGGRMQKKDPSYPDQELQATVNEARVGRDTSEQVGARPETTLRPAQEAADFVEDYVDTRARTLGQRAGEAVEWNMAKTMRNFGPVGTRISELLFDQNRNLSRMSVEGQHRAVYSDILRDHRLYAEELKATMAEQGAGLWNRITQPAKSARIMDRIQREVQTELFRREQLQRDGLPLSFENVPPRIKRMADQEEAVGQRALREMKAAGVDGAEDIAARAGWHHRQWSPSRVDDVEAKFRAAGLSQTAAARAASDLLSEAIRKANHGLDADIADKVASAILNRTKRRGELLDGGRRVGDRGLAEELRDFLEAEGLRGDRLSRAMQIVDGRTGERAKPGFMKQRMDIDYNTSAVVNGETVRVTDMIDPNLLTITDRYIKQVSSQVAWARMGYANPNDIERLRQDLIRSIPNSSDKRKAERIFDDATRYLRGDPAGEQMNDAMRALSMYGRMISLRNSGLWQVMEYATIQQRYGMVKSTKYAIQHMPGFRRLWTDAGRTEELTSSRLNHVLFRQSDQDIRIQPYVTRFEDNFEMNMGQTTLMRLQQAEQLVPYANAMKFIHNHQARMASNLIVDRLVAASRGDRNSQRALQKYGIEQHVMDRLARETRDVGVDTAQWSDELWANVRPAFSRMMDEAVLHARMGDMPHFAMFDKLGKFLFTYRTFMLTAHNKLLAGSLSREGMVGASALIMYQFPLAMLSIQAQQQMRGEQLSMEDTANRALGLMGGLGLAAELFGILSGERDMAGAPGMIPIDRMYSTLGSAASGNAEATASGIMNLIPVLSLVQPIRSLETLVTED